MRHRQSSKQPDLRPAKEQRSGGLRGGAYDTKPKVIKDWTRSGDATGLSNFDPGVKGGKTKMRKKWPY
jgi:hypothetical protein